MIIGFDMKFKRKFYLIVCNVCLRCAMCKMYKNMSLASNIEKMITAYGQEPWIQVRY